MAAVRHNAAEFSKRMEVIAEGVVENVAKTVRKAALAVDQVAVTTTPVDTGRARANWLTSVGSPSNHTVPSPGPGSAGQQAIAQGQSVIGAWKGGPIFITNNVEYVVPLDKGSSAQAPSGMTAAALQAGRKVVEDARVLPRK